jgi:hypothetical protein
MGGALLLFFVLIRITEKPKGGAGPNNLARQFVRYARNGKIFGFSRPVVSELQRPWLAWNMR